MQFRQHQRQAQIQTTKLLAWFFVLLGGLSVAVNVLLALLYKLIVPFSSGYPALFFETNTALVVLFVIGGLMLGGGMGGTSLWDTPPPDYCGLCKKGDKF